MSVGTVPPESLSVECRNCLELELEFMYDDLMEKAEDEDISPRERRRASRSARKLKNLANSPRKMARVEKFVADKAYSHHVATGRVGAFGDGSILAWLQDGGLEELLKFILGIMGGIADLFLVGPFIAMCIVSAL
tara:strand:+ start:32 stop:436 length:405 start_codon:yes stop_codon:yes gene_type:complete